ncbi:hypothetical protein V8C26DRAFT_416196 [Trichoderma gracile]
MLCILLALPSSFSCRGSDIMVGIVAHMRNKNPAVSHPSSASPAIRPRLLLYQVSIIRYSQMCDNTKEHHPFMHSSREVGSVTLSQIMQSTPISHLFIMLTRTCGSITCYTSITSAMPSRLQEYLLVPTTAQPPALDCLQKTFPASCKLRPIAAPSLSTRSPFNQPPLLLYTTAS